MSTSREFRSLLTIAWLILTMTTTALAADPGLAYSVGTAPGTDDKKGSFLFFNIYTSSIANPVRQNTRINLTNTSDTSSVFVHLFFIDGATCAPTDRFICLTQNQTTTFLASEQDPGITGHLIANAVDLDGLPLQFNHLIGDALVKFESGHFAALGAEAYAKVDDTNIVSADGSLVLITFSPLPQPGRYEPASRVVALDNIPSRADGNDTLLILNRFGGGSLVFGGASLFNLFGLLYNDAEEPFSFTFAGGCQLRSSLTNNLPRTSPRFEVVIPSGQTGWMKIFSPLGDLAITGSVINFNANAAVGAGTFNGGHNLHKMRLTFLVQYILPVLPPSC